MDIVTWIKSWYDRVHQLPWFNKYSVTLIVFAVWMLFFDKHNAIVQVRLSYRLNTLENKIAQSETELQKALAEKEMLEKHSEQYAREKYYMHRPDEDVFILVED